MLKNLNKCVKMMIDKINRRYEYRTRTCKETITYPKTSQVLVDLDDCNNISINSEAAARAQNSSMWQKCVQPNGGSGMCADEGLDPMCKWMYTYSRNCVASNCGSYTKWKTSYSTTGICATQYQRRVTYKAIVE